MRTKFILILLTTITLSLLLVRPSYSGDDKSSGKIKQRNNSQLGKIQSGKSGDAYRLFINNVNLPMNRAGVLADVNVPDPNPTIGGEGGKFAGDISLFS